MPYPASASDSRYDLVVVGGGLSGLAAARFFREQRGHEARILVLDNHDDFGGHAKRNEFTVDGHTLIGYGGSQSIDTPSGYSPQSAALLRALGIDTSALLSLLRPGNSPAATSWDRNCSSTARTTASTA